MMKKLTLTRKEKILFVLPLLVLTWPLISSLRQDELDLAMRKVAGSNAVDCGSFNGNLSAEGYISHKRAGEAFRLGKPFFYREVASNGEWAGTVWTPERNLYMIAYNGRSWRKPKGTIEFVLHKVNAKLVILPDGFLNIINGPTKKFLKPAEVLG